MKILIRKIIIFFLLVFIFVGFSNEAFANNLNAYFFYGDGCPHCALERYFLFNEVKVHYPELGIYEYEVYNNQENINLLKQISDKLNTRVDGVPFLVIGDQPFIGYASGITSEVINSRVRECIIGQCPDSVAEIVGLGKEDVLSVIIEGKSTKRESFEEINNELKENKNITLPFLGETNMANFSLPLLTIIVGVLDGFNPCAMWVLLFLISLLLGIKDRKRKWLLGIVFIIASASVYFIFMAAWLNLILFLGLVFWVKITIGFLAILGGGYSLKEFIFNKDSGCKVTGDEKRRRIFDRMRSAVQQNSLWLAMGGIIVLAFAVNLVELICSAGLPAIYTQVLAMNNLSNWQYYLYILTYIFFFMLDDLFIFFIAMITLEMTGITTKYARLSRLLGGIIMLIIGLLLIFKPEWLMFG
jgi:glutaredoxin